MFISIFFSFVILLPTVSTDVNQEYIGHLLYYLKNENERRDQFTQHPPTDLPCLRRLLIFPIYIAFLVYTDDL